MQYTKEKFLKDVRREAKSLRDNATSKEKSNLNFDELDPNSQSRCIYGQMTGNCRSDRAVKLITAGCRRFVENEDFAITPQKFTDVKKKINGTKSESPATTHYLSAIETYIFFGSAKRKNLIDYIKGETKELVL